MALIGCSLLGLSPAAGGDFTILTNEPGGLRIEVRSWPATGRIELPPPLPNVTAAHLADGPRRLPLNWRLDAQATKLEIELPAPQSIKLPVEMRLETAEKTEQFADGRITFSAIDGHWAGEGLTRVSRPGDSHLTSWTNSAQEVAWDFSPTRWGSYELELTYAAELGTGISAEADIAGQRLTAPLPATGGSSRYAAISLGRVYLAKADPFKVRLRCAGLEAKGGMNFKALTLRPAPEGKPVRQESSGAITLAAHDATTHSVQMRYEPAAIKNCLGYWVNPQDWADWDFEVTQPGTFELEVWQGCGQGQGGSDVAVEVAGNRLSFGVEETGHFQIFLPRRLGRVELPAAGSYSLAIKPQRKQAGAIMDVRQVRLLPVAPAAAQAPQFPGKRSLWFGFERFDFEVDGKPVLVVAPKREAPGRPWAWHGEFFGHKPNPDLALLGRGFHVVYMSVPDMLGSPEAVAHWNVLYGELAGKYGFAKKTALVGLSRGGLYVYNWAAANPQRVACIYGDAPVCDFKSWPGAFGQGKRSDRDWQLVLERYGFKSDAEAKAYGNNPVDNLQPLADAKVPLLHVYGDADEVVPWQENTGVLAERYRKLGGSISLIAKPGVQHHPHGLDDSTPIVDFIWQHTALPEAKAWLAARGGGPIDAGGRPLIRKLGTIDLDLVETTPVVFNGRLYRFEWVREGYWNNQRKTNYFRFLDRENGEVLPPFAEGHEFGSAFVHDQAIYVTGTRGRGAVDVFSSRDLKHWESWPAIAEGRYGIFNTSLCRAGEEFVLMFEIDRPVEEAGAPFTARFAKSRDLRNWTITPPECNYAKDRYTAPHCLRWLEGWFYDFYLEAHDGYETRVVRSRDLAHWEPSPLNPVLRASPEDKLIANVKLDGDQRARIAHAVNLNNSDIDFCQWQGRLVINYSWGNQQGVEHLAEALYDGTEAQFLKGWFPDGKVDSGKGN
jgi:pimeloyl-ACP methyl ester carboxylesterase